MSLILDSSLPLVESSEFTGADALLFLLLLFSQLQLFVTSLPELGEFSVLLHFGRLLFLQALNLKLTTSLDGELHLHLSALLLFKKSVCLVLGLSDLFVKHVLLVVLNCTELLDLFVNHAAAFSLFLSEALRFFLLLHEIACSLLLGEFFDALFFLEFLETSCVGKLHLLGVSLNKLLLHLLCALLSGQFASLLALKILISLAFDELTFEHFFLEAFNEVQFKLFELVTDGLGVGDLVFVLNLELALHLSVILAHLSLLHLVPVLVNLFLDANLSLLKSLLGLLLVVDIAHHHFGLKRFDLVLSLVHVLVSFLELLVT